MRELAESTLQAWITSAPGPPRSRAPKRTGAAPIKGSQEILLTQGGPWRRERQHPG
jgi:hypothetical protein